MIKWIIIIGLIIFIIFCTWALMKSSADSEIIEERLFQEYVNKKYAQDKEDKEDRKDRNDILSDLTELEKQTVDKLLDEFHKNMDTSEI